MSRVVSSSQARLNNLSTGRVKNVHQESEKKDQKQLRFELEMKKLGTKVASVEMELKETKKEHFPKNSRRA